MPFKCAKCETIGPIYLKTGLCDACQKEWEMIKGKAFTLYLNGRLKLK